MEERVYWLGFSLFPGIGPKKFDRLLQYFSSASQAWEAEELELRKVLGKALSSKFVSFRQTVSLEEYVEQVAKAKAWFTCLNDNEYPSLLKESSNPPFVLYGKGNRDVLAHTRTIGVVGTRKITNYGQQVTRTISRQLSSAGFCIVSGLAMGVDALAHTVALEEEGKTIAVLGSGVDCCTPSSNYRLYERIITEGSCVVSEYPLGIGPTIGSFPSRNRIIAGLSQAVLVTEGAHDSGALITASDCLSNKRPVFAIPGPITASLSQGPNLLLQQGATLIMSAEDIIRALHLSLPHFSVMNKKKIEGDTPEEQCILTLLEQEELSFDELCQKSSYAATQLNSLLSMMEMKGMIRQIEDGNYIISTAL